MTALKLANTLLEALNQELIADGSKDDMNIMTIFPGGSVPTDYTGIDDCNGTAYVQLVSANPTQVFPTAATTVNNCAYSLAYVFEMSIQRRAPLDPETFGQDTTLPPDTDHYDAAERQYLDMELMHRAIKNATRDIEDVVLGSYTPFGPMGGVVAGTWGVTVGDEF